MNFETLDADEVKLLTKHFTEGRSGNKVEFIVIHHNAGDLSIQQCYNVWQSREASAHYQVESSGRIGQLVWDSNTAWHSGNWTANCKSIGVEHANQGDSFTDACIESGSHLVAALCKNFGIGRPTWGVNVFPHSHFSPTACPGALKEGTSYHNRYIQRAGEWYDAMCGDSTPQPNQPSTSGNAVDLNALADAVMRGDYGNGEQRRAALGSNYDAVQAIVNERYGISSSGSSTSSVDIDDLARRVIAGEFGNGDSRRNALGSNYDAVQARVNEILGVGSSSSVDIDDLARRTIAGEFGNGEQRRAALGSNYDAVQARVNQMLS